MINEESAWQSDTLYRSLIKSTHAIAWRMDLTTRRFTYMARQVEQLWGYPAESWVDRDTWAERIHPDDREEATSFCAQATERGEDHDFVYRALTADGKVFWIRNFVSVLKKDGVPGELIGFMFDITESHEAEQRRGAIFKINEAMVRTKDLHSMLAIVHEQVATLMEASNFYVALSAEVGEDMYIFPYMSDERDEGTVPLDAPMKLTKGFTHYVVKKGKPLLADKNRVQELVETGEVELVGTASQSWMGVPLKGETGDTIGIVAVQSYTDKNAYSEKDLEVLSFVSATIAQSVQRKRVEERLQSTQQAIDHSATPTYWVRSDARICYVNEAACRVLGYSPEELLAMNVSEIDPNYPQQLWPEHWREMKEAGVMNFEAHHKTKSGQVIPVEIHTSFFRQGEEEYIWAFVYDISERKRVEEEQRKLELQVQQTQKLESLGVMAGGIAHDFNNLLMGILGNADLALLDLPSVSPARGKIHEIIKASRRAAELSAQMLAYSGKGRFVVEAVNLNNIVIEMSQLLESSLSKNSLLNYNLAEDIPMIEADVTQIRQVVLNLITNASEALGEEMNVICLTTGMMDCDRAYLSSTYLDEHQPEGKYVYLEVSDTGCGMDEETAERIFDPFFTTKFMGRGLGLAALLGIVRGHKGAITVHSEPGKGTTIRILFPAPNKPAVVSEEELKEKVGRKGGSTILLVDDEETVLKVVKSILERLGFSVLTGNDGHEALKLFHQHAQEIACVILDLSMPHMGGEETFRRLCRIKSDVRVILSSGYSEQEVTERFAGEEGIAGFIHKPFRSTELAAKLEQVLNS